MPKVSEHKEARLRRMIRDLLAIDPLISMEAIRHNLSQKTGAKDMDHNYVRKLVRKVQREVLVDTNTETIEKRIGEIRETNRIVKEELLRIAFPPLTTPVHMMPSVSERRKALDSIVRLENQQAKLEMDFGLFTRKLGELNIDHRLKPIDDQTLDTMMTAWKMWFSTPIEMRKYKPPTTIKVEVRDITNEPVKPPTAPESAQSAPAPKPIPIVTGAGLVPIE